MNTRRFPVGSEPVPGGVSFRVWAPDHATVSVVITGKGEHPLAREVGGYFAAEVAGATVGDRYRLRLGDGEMLYPDPASRYQPDGPHDASAVVDPLQYRWGDAAWGGARLEGQVVYEMHVGTFTPEGTWAAAAEKLKLLKDVGITLIEMMPLHEFPGRFGWGYDGVAMFAPTRLYGVPDDLRRFVDAAHAVGIGVILDVVYNHLGPDGNYLSAFTPEYFTDRYVNDWGASINFDGEHAQGVRDFFIANAAYWIAEFHFDGLRLDATQSIHDASDEHVLAAISKAARAAAGDKPIVLIAENEPQETRLVRSLQSGGYGIDALWNDDLHHSAMVALTGHSEAYYEDHCGTPQEFISAAKYGYLFQGQLYSHQQNRRGTPALDLLPPAFVTFIQNHDQVANSGRGQRFHQMTSPGQARAMTALILLLPGTPMLFQGQEFWASSPFHYFADHKPDLAEMVRKGRLEFMSQFPSVADAAMEQYMPAPEAEATFAASRLDWDEFDRNAPIVALHRDLLALRREDPVFSSQGRGIDGAVLSAEAFVLRFFGEDGDDRMMLVNFGSDLRRPSFAEPLLAAPFGKRWQVQWSSEDPTYGGTGTSSIERDDGWRLPGHATVVFAAVARD